MLRRHYRCPPLPHPPPHVGAHTHTHIHTKTHTHTAAAIAAAALLQVLLNVLADEIHRAHQRCLMESECDPNRVRGCTPPACWPRLPSCMNVQPMPGCLAWGSIAACVIQRCAEWRAQLGAAWSGRRAVGATCLAAGAPSGAAQQHLLAPPLPACPLYFHLPACPACCLPCLPAEEDGHGV